MVNISKENPMLNKIMKHLEQLFDTEFDRCWEILKHTQPKKIRKVKRNFAFELSAKIFGYCVAKFTLEYKMIIPTVESMVNYVFHYHYFYTNTLSDSERASLQNNEEYKKRVQDYISHLFLQKAHSLKPNSSATIYNPEIYTCDLLCDFFIKKAQSLNISLTNEDEKLRFTTLRNLFLRAFGYVKSILTLLTQSFPAEAITTWRTLFEIEYTILVLIKYGSVLSKYYHKFGEFSFLDEDSDEQALTEYERFAKEFNQKPYLSGFRNYGWILTEKHEEQLKPNLKSLLKIAKFNEYDHEDRYQAYKDASKFSHSNAVTINISHDNYGSYAFVITNLLISIQNLKYAFIKFLDQYSVTLDDSQHKELESLFKEYVETYRIFEKNCKSKLDKIE